MLRSIKCRANQIFRHVGLIGEVDSRLYQRLRLDNLPPPSLRLVADQPLELAVGRSPLRRCFRGDQIGEALHFRKIKPAIVESTARKLARLRRPEPSIAPSASSTADTTAKPPWS